MFKASSVNFFKRLRNLEKESQENINKIQILLDKQELLFSMIESAYEDSEKNKVLYDPERDMWLSRINGFRSFISRKDKATLFSKKEAEFIKTQFHEELEIQTIK